MQSYQDHLNQELTDPAFREAFEEEKRLLALGLRIAEERRRQGISQRELAHKSRITQQQLSRIENGVNSNILTFIKISRALGLPLSLECS